MNLLTVDEVRARVETPLSDYDLQLLLDTEEAELIRRFGPHYDGTAITEEHEGGERNIYLRRPATSVSAITETLHLGADEETVAATEYHLWKGQGRIERLPSANSARLFGRFRERYSGTIWGEAVTVTYIPQDDTERRRSALIELVRLATSRTTLSSESIAGEYSYSTNVTQTGDGSWDALRARAYRSCGFMNI